MKTITMEVPENVLIAIMHVAQWGRSTETGDEITSDDIVTDDIPLLEAWLMGLGVLPECVYSDEGVLTNVMAGSVAHLTEEVTP